MAGISIWQLAIVTLIIVLLFGTRKLRGIGSDLGSAIHGFKQAVNDPKSVSPVSGRPHNDASAADSPVGERH